MKVGKWTAAIHFTNRLHIKILPEKNVVSKTGRYEFAWLIFVLCLTIPYNPEGLLSKTEEKKEDEA